MLAPSSAFGHRTGVPFFSQLNGILPSIEKILS